MAIDRKIIEARVDEVLSANDAKAQPKTQGSSQTQGAAFQGFGSGMPDFDGQNPFAAFGAAQGFGTAAGKAPSPLKMKLIGWATRLATKPKFTRFLQKKWWPLWVLVGILFSGLILAAGVLFLIYKLVQSVVSAYTDLFKK